MSVAEFIACQRTEYRVPHALSCRALGVSESWFYQWHDRPPTSRQQRREELTERIGKIFAESGGTYGSPRVADDLWAEGWRVSVNTVAGIMAEQGLVARPRRRRRSLTKPGRRSAARDHVRRQFVAVAPNLLWCGDLTEIVSGEGKLYLATVLDLFSRKCLGYAFGAHHDADLAQAALVMAIAHRGGQALDNAVAEAFNSTIKVEYVYRHHFATHGQARTEISHWITTFYNPRRRHSACNRMSPDDYEKVIADARGSTGTS